MKQGRRFGFSAEQKLDEWRRWKAGQTLIGRAFGKEHSSIRCLVSRHGGIAPAARRRQNSLTTSWGATIKERYGGHHDTGIVVHADAEAQRSALQSLKM